MVRGEVELADDVEVGPGCQLDGTMGAISIGPGTRLRGHAYLTGPLTLGERNRVYPFVCLGFAPQSVAFDPDRPGCGLVIGDGNTFREGVTVHRAMTEEGPTRVGDGNFFMAGSHVGHDGRVGDRCVFANGAALGGHVRVDDRVTIGGGTMVHQFARIGRNAMLSGGTGLSRDLPPFFMLTALNVAGSLNVVGMRRAGLGPDEIDDVRWVYKTLYRRGLSVARAREELQARADRPLVAEYLAFLDESKRGLCPAEPSSKRGTVAAGDPVDDRR